MPLLSTSEIEALHRKYAPCDAVFDLVWNHSCIVRDIALRLADDRALNVDIDLVRAGCLLHDIGVHPMFDANGEQRTDINYMMHGMEGEAILKKEGFPEAIWRFASHHMGVGLSRQDIIDQKHPLPQKNYLAETDEELLIMYADKFHSKTTPPYFTSYAWYKQHLAQFGDDKVAKFEEMSKRFGIPDLLPLSKKYGYPIR